MVLSQTIILFALAISAHTLPHQQKHLHLSPRSNYGWIGNLANCTSEAEPFGPRPKIEGDCISFSPQGAFVGISWGSWPLDVSTLEIFESDDCTGDSWTNWVVGQDKNGPGSCFEVKDLERGVGSLKIV